MKTTKTEKIELLKEIKKINKEMLNNEIYYKHFAKWNE